MKLEKGMIVRLLNNHGRHKKNNVYIIKDVLGSTALGTNVKTEESIVLYSYSSQVELVSERGSFYV